jgi:hypothetical protein
MLAACATAASVVQGPCVAACTARFVADEELQRAQALRAAIGQGAIVVGPALGALALLVAGPAVAILLNALTFIASALAIVSIAAGPAFAPARAAGDGDPGASVLADVRAGAQALRGASAAVRLVAADLVCSAVYGLLSVTLVLVSRRLGAGAGGYGLLLGAFGVGGVIGAGVAARIDAPARWRGMLTVALLLVGASVAALGSVSTLAGALALALLGGGGMIVGEVLSDTALPRMLDDDVLARAYGLVLPASIGGIVVGSLAAGPLVSLLGVRAALIAAGALVLVAAGLLLRRPLAVAGAQPAVAVVPAPSA